MKKLAAMFTASQEEIREDLEGNTWVHEDALVPEELQAVEQAHAELQDAHDDVAEAVDVADGLDETAALSQEALDSGNAALALKIATTGISAMCRRVDLESIDLTPSVEEGGGLKRAAKAAWETIVKVFKIAVEKFKAFATRIRSFFIANKTHTEEVKNALEKSKISSFKVPKAATVNDAKEMFDYFNDLVNEFKHVASRAGVSGNNRNLGFDFRKTLHDVAGKAKVLVINAGISYKDSNGERFNNVNVRFVDNAFNGSLVTKSEGMSILSGIITAQNRISELFDHIAAADKEVVSKLEDLANTRHASITTTVSFSATAHNQREIIKMITASVKLYCELWHKTVTVIDHEVKAYK